MTKRLERKSFMASFALHGMVFVGYLILAQSNPIKMSTSGNEIVSMQINMVEYKQPAPVVQEFTPPPPPPPPKPIIKQEAPKPVVKPKPIKKELPKPKPIEKPRVVEKAPVAPVEAVKEVAEVVPEEVFHEESTATQVAQSSGPPPSAVANKQALLAAASAQFVQTNFTIIRDMVLRNLVYPNIARRMGQTGVVEMTLVIDKKGKLKEYFVSKSSGHKTLDTAALRSVERVAKADFPKPKSTSTVILPIGFRLN
ncbi:energy transducer TonB [Sulfurospirillum sp. T05]|uniref:Energy transducer TonB n=1 Tax=Sulfurospirillum tamanense TaxID=2813362 RepID=A0ABS2WTZ0_9BACT|nr:energy transducer TonB [Sulfurospirillum tamanensis]MBN2965110.1 energy transducer TonB [Sulfurospirillum tamanensis]